MRLHGGREPLLKTCVGSGDARDPGKFLVMQQRVLVGRHVCVCVCVRERESLILGALVAYIYNVFVLFKI